MGWLYREFAEMNDDRLLFELQAEKKKVEMNDGRLTSSSSADLDYALECVEVIEQVLEFRLSDNGRHDWRLQHPEEVKTMRKALEDNHG